jgi:hypothetical protein
VITYLIEENRVLKAQLGGRRLRLSDTERRRLTALAPPLAAHASKRWRPLPRQTPSCAGTSSSLEFIILTQVAPYRVPRD